MVNGTGQLVCCGDGLPEDTPAPTTAFAAAVLVLALGVVNLTGILPLAAALLVAVGALLAGLLALGRLVAPLALTLVTHGGTFQRSANALRHLAAGD